MKQSNFSRLEAEGLIDKGFQFTDDDRRAIESLSAEEVETIIRLASRLDPGHNVRDSSSGAIRGIIL
jgi:hypothetical protein